MLLLMYHIFAPLRPCAKNLRRFPPKFPNLPLDTPVLLSIIERMTIDATIQRLTNDGEVVVQFLVDVIQGTNYNAPLGHRIKSAEWLSALGGFIPEDAIPKSATIRPRPKSEPENGKRDKRDERPEVTEKQILHFDIARLIKQETNDGETVVEFLIRVISKIEKSGENFTPAARMRAAKELLIRGFGSAIPGVSRILSGKTEELDSYLSKIVREYTDHGADSVRFLVKAMENKTPEATSKGAQTPYPKFERQRKGKPAEGFTASQRVWAACELLRRAYDIRTDHITPEDIQAYWKSQSPAADNAADADSSPDIDRMGITPKDIQAETPAIARASKVADNAATRDKSEKRPAAVKENPDADNTPSDTLDRAARRRQKRDARKAQKRAATEQPAAAKNIPVAEKPAITAEKRDDHKQRDDAEKREDNRRNAANTPSANPGRAARRRQKRAARKAQKRNAANTPFANPIPGIHATDINENTVVFSHEPISPEELTRLRKTLAQPDDIPPNARSP